MIIEGRSGACALLLLVCLLNSSAGQLGGQECLNQFREGKEGFVLDTDESVKDGATFLSSPKLNRYRDCVAACCKEPKCNVAFMEKGAEEGLVQSCFLFDCLYKKRYACRFVRKKGYLSYILDSVYEDYLSVDQAPTDTDRPPVADGGPDVVVQPQEIVTLNGMRSSDDNEVASYRWTMLTAYPGAVIDKTDFADQIIVSNLIPGMYKFQLTVTDNVGQSDSTKVTVRVLTELESEHHCMVPKKVGPCRGAFPRWHYNAASEKCEQFMFGGCRENLNNYLSMGECETACHGLGKSAPSGRGISIPSTQGEKCGVPCTAEQFTCDNGCCLDPGLECDSTPQCSDSSDEQKCKDYNKNFEILRKIPIDEQKVRCTEAPDTGSCRDSLTKWYYDPLKRDCFRFNYGGCQGNKNRFDSKDSCTRACDGVTDLDVFARQKEEGEAERRVSESETGIIVTAALLGTAIAIMLGILVYCMLKGRKSSQRQRVPVNNAPITSIEDREHLVYNSTTKPI